MADQKSDGRKVWVYHPQQELGDAIASGLDGSGMSYEFKDQEGIDNACKKPFCILVFEERKEELANFLTKLLKKWLEDDNSELPGIVLLTFADRLHLKAVFTRPMAFPCLSECLKLGIINLCQLPSSRKEINEAVNAVVPFKKPEEAKELKASLDAEGRTFISPNMEALKLLNWIISQISDDNEKRTIVAETFDLMNEDSELDSRRLWNFFEDVALEVEDNEEKKDWLNSLRKKPSNHTEESLWTLLYELLEKKDPPEQKDVTAKM